MGRRGKRSGRIRGVRGAALTLACLLASCSGGDQQSGDGTGTGAAPCDGFCYDTPTNLTVSDVERVLAQAASEARAQQGAAVIAVTDRVGNVLAVYRMGGAPETVRVGSPPVRGNIDGGLEGIALVPSAASAIAKAVTGAYLSSEGNAFGTRSASQIVQANFNPGESNAPGGPLFGVQFSQLPCSDLSSRFVAGAGPGPGPHRSPLGLSADPGGLPLYKNGTVVGGIGVEADGQYTLDPSVFDIDRDIDELIAVAGSFGFAAPVDRRADRITVDGKLLRLSDVAFGDLASNPSAAPALSAIDNAALVPVRGYTETSPAIAPGTAFGQNASGYAPASDPAFAALDAFVLVDRAGVNRFPPSGDTGFAAAEVRQVLLSAITVANRARGQIRRPLGSQMRATVSVVGRDGQILGIARTRDAPIFGTDVSLQKARTALLFSRPDLAQLIGSLPPAGYLRPGQPDAQELRRVALSSYVEDLSDFLEGQPAGLQLGQIAFANRSIGNLARPSFPDGITGSRHGPLSKPAGEWSPFSTGLQLDLGYNAVIRHVAFVAGLPVPDVPQQCAGVEPLGDGLDAIEVPPLARNGIQIFPGSVPIYRGNALIGAVGVSGDGIEQDDMVAFLGLNNAGVALNGAIGNAPREIRADRIEIEGLNLRYIQCPQAPFLDSDDPEVCNGK